MLQPIYVDRASPSSRKDVANEIIKRNTTPGEWDTTLTRSKKSRNDPKMGY